MKDLKHVKLFEQFNDDTPNKMDWNEIDVPYLKAIVEEDPIFNQIKDMLITYKEADLDIDDLIAEVMDEPDSYDFETDDVNLFIIKHGITY
jgi:hypothetical protein